MRDLPYVRNAPLLAIGANVSSEAVELVGGDVAIELRASAEADRMDLASTARHLAKTWNFHDPLTDALRALATAPQDNDALTQAQRVLTALASPLTDTKEPTGEHEETAPWLPRAELTAPQAALQRARSHLSEGFRLTCLAAPKYSQEGREELVRAQELLAEVATLLAGN
jgi:hypothetical protein